jgi:S1-C subfamily serine protease
MHPNQIARRRIRFIMLALIVVLGAYWAGARYGPRTPVAVEAVPASATTVATPPPPSTESLGPLEAENVRIYHQAAPAVANIVTKTVEYDFFYNAVPVEGAGSGFVIDPAGHILTNYHVVENARTIEVTLGDQTRYKATYIGADERNDIALIKIDAPGKKLAALPLGDSRNLQVGQRVLAIGNPFGFQSTLTTGVVSALGRTVQTSDTAFIDEAIQTDAAINRGNSGGPLMNSHGEVIGINSAIYTPSGTTAGIGFAIPINTARRVADDLINLGRVRQATLGIQGRAIWPGLADALDLPVEHGLLIESTTKGGPAAQAGVQGGNRTVQAGLQQLRIGGDILVAVDQTEINTQLDLGRVLNRHKPGDTITLTIYRGGKKQEVKVTLADR